MEAARETDPTDVLDFNLMDLEMARRKRRREAEPEEELPDLPELPLEAQLRIVEQAEKQQRGADPRAVTELIRAYRDAYQMWLTGRLAKLEDPPSIFTLALARLFVSPRFKLLTSLPGRATEQIVKAWDRKENFLILFRLEETLDEAEENILNKSVWQMGYASRPDVEMGTSEGMIKLDIHYLSTVPMAAHFPAARPSEIELQLDEDSTYADAIERDQGVSLFAEELEPGDVRYHMRELILYGQADPMIAQSAADELVEQTRFIVQSWYDLFFMDGRRDRPELATPTQLAWRNKVFFIRVEETMWSTGDTLEIGVVYKTGPGSDPIFTSAYTTVDTLVDNVRVNAVKDTEKQARKELSGQLKYTVFVRWSPRISVVVYDTETGWNMEMGGTIFAETAKALDRIPDQAFGGLLRDEAWGYNFTTYFGDSPRLGGSTGILIIPAPWFFHILANPHAHVLRFNRAKFRFTYDFWESAGVHPTILSTGFILAHQPYEMIYLQDDIGSEDLDIMTLLQKRDIPKRATAKLPAVCVS